eukprot:COSAG02_NODE_22831_length_739_cov_0.960938_1_plen_86_part_10
MLLTFARVEVSSSSSGCGSGSAAGPAAPPDAAAARFAAPLRRCIATLPCSHLTGAIGSPSPSSSPPLSSERVSAGRHDLLGISHEP